MLGGTAPDHVEQYMPSLRLLFQRLAFVSCAGLAAGGLSSRVQAGLPAVSKDQFLAQTAVQLADLKKRPNYEKAASEKKWIDGWVLVAPIEYEWGHSGNNLNIPAKYLPEPNQDRAYKLMLQWVHAGIVEGLKARGHATSDATWVQSQRQDIKFGSEPYVNVTQRSKNGQMMSMRSYMAYDWPQWSPEDFRRTTPRMLNRCGGAVFITVSGGWDYDGHVEFNGEPTVIYDVYETFTVTVCDADNRCNTVKIGHGNPLVSKRGMVTKQTKDEAAHKDNNQFFIEHNAKITAEAVLALLDQMMAKKQQ